MKRTNIIELNPSKRQEKILKECMLLSSCIYNSANYIVRQQIFKKEDISSFFELYKLLQSSKDYQLLGRVYARTRLQQFSEMISSWLKLEESKTQESVGLPTYYKNRKTNTTIPSYLIFEGVQFSISKNSTTIPLSREMRKKYSIKHFRINYNGVLKHQGKQCRSEIHYKNKKFYLYQSVEVSDSIKKSSNVMAGLDLGIKKPLALCTNTNQELIIGSKRFFRQWQYITNVISKEQQKLSKINRKASNNLSRLYYNRTIYQDNLFNNLVAKMFRFLNRNNVSKLFIGDLKNILEDNSKSKMLNIMTHNYWSFDKLLHKIQNKAEEFGIEIVMTTEEYTSRTCPICFDNSKENCKDRIFVCSDCGYIDHRDIIGARNIMLNGMSDQTQSAHWCEITPLEVL